MLRSIWPLLLSALLLSGCSPMEQQSESPEKIALAPISEGINLQKKWSVSTGKGAAKRDVKLLLAEDGPLLYTVDYTGHLTAVNAQEGYLVWNLDLKAPVSSGPTISEGKLVLGSNNGSVIAVNLAERKEDWRTLTSSEVLAAPKVADGIVFVNSMDGALNAFSLNDGRQLWTFTHNLPSLVLRRGSMPTVSGDLLIAGFSSGKLIALRKQDGTVDWTQDVGHPKGRTDLQRMVDISADPIVKDNIVYAASYQGNFVALSVSNGNIIWERKLSSAAGFILVDNLVFVSATNGDVLALDSSTGQTFWIQPALQGRMISKPAINGEYLIVADSDGNAHWLEKNTGKIVGRVKIDSKGVEATPIVNNNIVYILGRSGKLVAIEIK